MERRTRAWSGAGSGTAPYATPYHRVTQIIPFLIATQEADRSRRAVVQQKDRTSHDEDLPGSVLSVLQMVKHADCDVVDAPLMALDQIFECPAIARTKRSSRGLDPRDRWVCYRLEGYSFSSSILGVCVLSCAPSGPVRHVREVAAHNVPLHALFDKDQGGPPMNGCCLAVLGSDSVHVVRINYP